MVNTRLMELRDAPSVPLTCVGSGINEPRKLRTLAAKNKCLADSNKLCGRDSSTNRRLHPGTLVA